MLILKFTRHESSKPTEVLECTAFILRWKRCKYANWHIHYLQLKSLYLQKLLPQDTINHEEFVHFRVTLGAGMRAFRIGNNYQTLML